MKIGLDVDGTLTKSFEKATEEFNKNGWPDAKYEEFYNWEGYLKNGPTIQEHIDWYEDNKEWLRLNYELYEGSKAILTLLEKNELIIITARDSDLDKPHPSTQEWIDKEKLRISKVFYDDDKAIKCKELGIDVMIEDSPDKALAIAKEGIPVLLFDKHYNRDVKHPLITRFTHWIEVPKLLQSLNRS